MRQLEFLQACGQAQRGRVSGTASGIVVEPHMDSPIQEGARRQHHRAAPEADAGLRDGAHHAFALQHQVVHGLLEQPQLRLVLQPPADRGLVEDAVGLRARGAHGRALAGVEDAELDATLVGGGRHGAAQRVHFFHQVALTDAADGGVAAHLAQRLDVVGQQQGRGAHARGGQCRLGTGMATANHDDVEFLGMGVRVHVSTHLNEKSRNCQCLGRVGLALVGSDKHVHARHLGGSDVQCIHCPEP